VEYRGSHFRREEHGGRLKVLNFVGDWLVGLFLVEVGP
jgi:hypothetical protein